MRINKHMFFRLGILSILICSIVFSTKFLCLDKLSIRAATKAGLQRADHSASITDENGNEIFFLKNGVIVNYDIVYQAGVTDAEIAEWSAANSSSTTTQSKTADSIKEETPSTVENKDSNKNDSTTKNNDSEKKSSKTENAKTPTYTDDEIAAAWSESERAESTCIEAGHISYTNSLTGETKSEELPLADHKYSEIERKDATCSEAGSITYTCEVCGDTYVEEIPALSHEYEWVTTKEATLFTPGEEQYVCKNCGDVSETREISGNISLPVVLGILVGVVFTGGLICMIRNVKKKNKIDS